MPDSLLAATERHLHTLVDGHPDRHTGRGGGMGGALHPYPLVEDMDALGERGAGTAVSVCAVGERGVELIFRVVRRHVGVSIGEAWHEGDHGIVAGRGRSTAAMTSTSFREPCQTVGHTERDALELVDPVAAAVATEFVADLVRSLPAIDGAGA